MWEKKSTFEILFLIGNCAFSAFFTPFGRFVGQKVNFGCCFYDFLRRFGLLFANFVNFVVGFGEKYGFSDFLLFFWSAPR